MNAKVRKLAETLLDLIDSAKDQAMYDEIVRVHNVAIPLASAIRYGLIDRLTAEGVSQIEDSITDIHVIIEHGTWQRPGQDVPVYVELDAADCATTEIVKVGYRRVRIPFALGRHISSVPLKREIDAMLAELGFEPCRYARRTFTGVVFHTRHAGYGDASLGAILTEALTEVAPTAHTWQTCSHRDDFRSEAHHDNECPAAPENAGN